MKTEWYDAKDFEKIGPGLYRATDGQLHVMIPELLDHFGYADTPENRDVATKAAIEEWRRRYPSVSVHEA